MLGMEKIKISSQFIYDIPYRKRYGIKRIYKNVVGLGLSYIYVLVLTQFSFTFFGLELFILQTYKEDFGLEKVFNIWWQGNVLELICG